MEFGAELLLVVFAHEEGAHHLGAGALLQGHGHDQEREEDPGSADGEVHAAENTFPKKVRGAKATMDFRSFFW